MLEAFLPKTFQLLQVHTNVIGIFIVQYTIHTVVVIAHRNFQAENGPKNHPDTVDDFFRLNARFLLRSPLPYLAISSLSDILNFCLHSAK